MIGRFVPLVAGNCSHLELFLTTQGLIYCPQCGLAKDPAVAIRDLLLANDALKSKLERTQRALSRSKPWKEDINGCRATCIHCGKDVWCDDDGSDITKEHRPGCVWLMAVMAVRASQKENTG